MDTDDYDDNEITSTNTVASKGKQPLKQGNIKFKSAPKRVETASEILSNNVKKIVTEKILRQLLPSDDSSQPSSPTKLGETETDQSAPETTSELEVASEAAIVSKRGSKKASTRATNRAASALSRATGGASLAGMVSDLKSKAEEEELTKDPEFASWLPPEGKKHFSKIKCCYGFCCGTVRYILYSIWLWNTFEGCVLNRSLVENFQATAFPFEYLLYPPERKHA